MCERFSLRTFIKKKSLGAANLDVKTAKFEEFVEQVGDDYRKGRVFIYKVKGSEGLVDKGCIKNDKDLKSAIIRLSTHREPVIEVALIVSLTVSTIMCEPC